MTFSRAESLWTEYFRVLRALFRVFLQRSVNLLLATSRASRVRSAQTVLLGAIALSAYTWASVRIFGESFAMRPEGVHAEDYWQAIASFVGLVLFMDAMHRAKSLSRQLRAIAVEQTLIVAGVSGPVRALVGWVRVLGRSSVWSPLPALTILSVTGGTSIGRGSLLLAAGACFGVLGDSAGRMLNRVNGGTRVVLWAVLGGWYTCVVSTIFSGFAGLAIDLNPLVVRVAIWPWSSLASSQSRPLVGVVTISGCLLVGLWAQRQWSDRRGWSLLKEIDPDAGRTVQNELRGESVNIRVVQVSRFRCLVTRELWRMKTWSVREPLALALLIVVTFWPALILLLQPTRTVLAFQDQALPWTATYCMSFWSLAAVELAWATDNRSEWATFRVCLGSVWIPAVSRVTSLLLVSNAIAILLSFPLLFHPLAEHSFGVFLLDAALPGASGVVVGSAFAVLGLRVGMIGDLSARLLRYFGVSAGLLIGPISLQLSGSRLYAELLAVALICIAMAAVFVHVRKLEFAHGQ